MPKQLFFKSLIRLGFPVQVGAWATVKNLHFSIRMPSDWKSESTTTSMIIHPDNDADAITISIKDNVLLPMMDTRVAILAMFAQPWDLASVQMKRYASHVEFNYSTFENEHYWHTRAFRKQDRMYVISINCHQTRWEIQKDIFMRCLDSFKMGH